ncbi:Diacylglycerol kinase [Pseudobythopirellula maris]|uniref:Diacylglycerol kinase n=2 Tax=Pseudobythopirellula maris TaxID=2527991 RepID=A0A5C5ZFC2_9BACT|nr:Diacylglycerol kinase [Pseudobythopirellula maris]
MLVNPMAGAARRRGLADVVASELAEHGYEVEKIGELAALHDAAMESHASGDLRCVLTVGGDGTFGAALNSTEPATPLAVLPRGTENLLAGYLGYGRSGDSVARLLKEGVAVRLDAGVANGRLFALLISAGFDAEVVRRVHAARRGHITRLAYAKPIFRALARYPYPKMRVTAVPPEGGPNGAAAEPQELARGSWLFASNLPRYASGLPITPHADGADGLADLCVLQRGQLMAGLWYLGNIVLGRHHRLESVETMRVAECLVEAEGAAPIPYQLDGDPGGFLPVRLAVVPGRMTMVVSRTIAERLGFALPDAALPEASGADRAAETS